MATKRRAKVSTSKDSPAKQLAGFIAKYERSVAKLATSLRGAMRKRLPTANELVYDNYQFLAIGYSATERVSETPMSLAISPKGVALCFFHGASLPDPKKILLGGGKQTRFVRLEGPATLKQPAVEALIRASLAYLKVPMPRSGRGRLVIKSISAKQRPRRRDPNRPTR